jgi:hypothetical protein
MKPDLKAIRDELDSIFECHGPYGRVDGLDTPITNTQLRALLDYVEKLERAMSICSGSCHGTLAALDGEGSNE